MTDLTPILQQEQKAIGEKLKQHVRDAFTKDWYFSGWEKILIVACFLWSSYSLGSWIWSII